jgi:hypothetical protein
MANSDSYGEEGEAMDKLRQGGKDARATRDNDKENVMTIRVGDLVLLSQDSICNGQSKGTVGIVTAKLSKHSLWVKWVGNPKGNVYGRQDVTVLPGLYYKSYSYSFSVGLDGIFLDSSFDIIKSHGPGAHCHALKYADEFVSVEKRALFAGPGWVPIGVKYTIKCPGCGKDIVGSPEKHNDYYVFRCCTDFFVHKNEDISSNRLAFRNAVKNYNKELKAEKCHNIFHSAQWVKKPVPGKKFSSVDAHYLVDKGYLPGPKSGAGLPGARDGHPLIYLDDREASFLWSPWYLCPHERPVVTADLRNTKDNRNTPFKANGCTCEKITPAKNFLDVTHRFYEANGLLGYLGAAPNDHEGDGGTMEVKLNAFLEADSRTLEYNWLHYLSRAAWGEARHAPGRLSKKDLEWAVGSEFRKKLQNSDGAWVGINKIAPCPICNPIEACLEMRKIWRVFNVPGWGSSFGGVAWRGIAEALLARLRFISDGIEGAKERLAREPQVRNESTMAKIFSNRIIWVDYINDLEHNGGCVLGKGFLHVDRHEFTNMLEWKKHVGVIYYPRFFPKESERIQCRTSRFVYIKSFKNYKMPSTIELDYLNKLKKKNGASEKPKRTRYTRVPFPF